MNHYRPFFVLWLSLYFAACYSYKLEIQEPSLLKNKINGMALMAPPVPFEENPMPAIHDLGMGWISIQPFAFFYKDKPSISRGTYQWWGERKEGIEKTVQLARKEGLKVMLKPQLWAYDQWIGDLEFDNDTAWQVFEADYRGYLLGMAQLADSLDIELLSVGTEVKQSAIQRPEFWRKLIHEIRAIYKGKLIYASNWDGYTQITFWDALDYIGIDAYFPLTPKKKPTVKQLKKAWQPTVDSLTTFQAEWQRPVIFTEYGYMSLDGCAYKAWLLEKKQTEVAINEGAQANAVQALLETFGTKDWWAGAFQWKWYADIHTVLSPDAAARDYTIQGKKARKVIEALCK